MTDNLKPESDLTAKQIERLQYSHKMLAELFSGAGFEIRTPFNKIIGYSELLAKQDYGPLNEEQQKFVENIYNTSRKLLHTVEFLTGKLPFVLLVQNGNIYHDKVDLGDLITEIGFPADFRLMFENIPQIQSNWRLLRYIFEIILIALPPYSNEVIYRQFSVKDRNISKVVKFHLEISNNHRESQFWENDQRLLIAQFGIESLGGELTWEIESDMVHLEMSLPITPDHLPS